MTLKIPDIRINFNVQTDEGPKTKLRIKLDKDVYEYLKRYKKKLNITTNSEAIKLLLQRSLQMPKNSRKELMSVNHAR